MENEQIPQETAPQASQKLADLEIEQIRERVEQLGGELQKESVPEKREQMVKEEIKTYLSALQQLPVSPVPVANRDEAKEISKFPANQQVGALISLVFDKGLKEAVQVAKNLDNPAILDEFHDMLADRYYEELIRRKLLKYI